MFVVRRAFKNYGEALLPGSVVEPGNIKNFKSRLRERVIIEVPEQDFEKWDNYFKTKFGVPITVQEDIKDAAKVAEDTNSNNGDNGTDDPNGANGTTDTDDAANAANAEGTEGTEGVNSTGAVDGIADVNSTGAAPVKPVVKVTATN